MIAKTLEKFPKKSVAIEAVAPGLFAANADGRGVAALAIRVRSDGSQTSVPVLQCGTAPCWRFCCPVWPTPLEYRAFVRIGGLEC